MATNLFLRATASDLDTGSIVGRVAVIGVPGTTMINRNTDLADGPIGADGIIATDGNGAQPMHWFSPSLGAVTISGTMTFNIWCGESTTGVNGTVQVRVNRISSTGTFISTVIDSEMGTEMSSGGSEHIWTATPTSTTLAGGDRLEITVRFNDATALTMGGAGEIAVVYWDGASGASGDTFVGFTETLTEYVPPPPPSSDDILNPAVDKATNSWTTDTGGTTSLYAAIDELSASDTDYVQSPAGPTTAQYYEVALETIVDPENNTGHIVHYRYRKNVAGGNVDLAVRLYQSTTLIAEWGTHTNIPNTWTQQDHTLPATGPDSAENITNYSDLRLRFTPNMVTTDQTAPVPTFVAQRASANSNSAVTTVDLALTGMTVGNYLIIRSSADNSGGGGAARSITLSNLTGTPVDLATDQVFQHNNDPGAASAGVTCNVGITKISATSGTVRMTYSGSVVQACVAEEWSGIHATTPIVGTPVGASGTASTNFASMTDASIAAGNVVLGVIAVEAPAADTFTQDADTTNGSWVSLAELGTTNATADTNQSTWAAYKTVSAAGAQTYNPTGSVARDSAGLILELAAAATPAPTIKAQVSWANLELPAAIAPESKAGTDTPTVGITDVATVVRNLFKDRADNLAVGVTDSAVLLKATLERLAPDAILTQTNITGAVGDINEDPDVLGLWTPALLPSLRFWLKADAITGLSDGAAVATWEDESGNGHDGAQATGINQPLYQTNVLNGLPAVEFSGSQDLDISGLAAEISDDDTYSLFILNQPRSFTIHPIMFTHPTTTDWDWIVEYNNFGDLYWGHVNGNYRLYNTDVVANDWPILSVVKTAATTGIVRKSGTEITIFTPTGSGMQTTPSLTDTVRMGAYYNHTIGFDGFIPEVIYCGDALSAGDVERVEGYLAHKWGRTADLPAPHPYKSEAPVADSTWMTGTGAVVLRTSFATPAADLVAGFPQEFRVRARPGT